jgi:hypothetical protein
MFPLFLSILYYNKKNPIDIVKELIANIRVVIALVEILVLYLSDLFVQK